MDNLISMLVAAAAALLSRRIAFCNIIYYHFLMVTVTVKLPPALASQLNAAARQKRVSKSALIRQSLEKTLANGKSRARPSLYERTKHLAGSVKGLPRDLSTNKKYMEGFGAS